MKDHSHRWTRRRFLEGTTIGAAALSLTKARGEATERGASAPIPFDEPEIYREIGVRPLVNAAGPHTALSGCVMPREVVRAMEQASRAQVAIEELQEAAGRRIAELTGAEAALVTSGCAAAMTVGTAACVAGTDPENIERLPDTTGMKDEVIFQKLHRFPYDHAIRAVGVKIVEVETRRELESAINERTAMMFFLNWADPYGQVGRREFAKIANEAGIPSMIDAAADLPPASNLSAFTEMGFDLVAFSGGKTLKGPQCSGLLLGKKTLIDAAALNGSPHSDSIGRIGKVGKEEIVGLMKAVELYVKKDHEAEYREWEEQVRFIEKSIVDIPGVLPEIFVPEVANHVPYLAIRWDERIGLTTDEFVKALREGDPRVEVRTHGRLTADGRHWPGHCPLEGYWPEVSTWFLEPGEYRIVAARCREVLEQASRA